MKALAVVLLAMAMAGCAGDGALKAQLAGAQIEIAKSKAQVRAKPVLDAEIPTANGIMKIVVHSPPSGNDDAVLRMPDDPWARVAGQGVEVLGTVLGIREGGRAAIRLTSEVGKAANHGYQYVQSPGAVTTTTTNTTTTSSTDSHAVDSHNTVDSHDISGSYNPVDNTGTPTVVYQPAPVVVTP